MSSDQEHIYRLLQKYKDNTATEAEKEELTAWYREKAYKDAEFPEHEAEVGVGMQARLNREIRSTVHSPRSTVDVSRFLIRTPWLAAASILLIMGIAVGVTYYAINLSTTPIATVVDNSIEPGSYTAILTLADGSKISLAKMPRGVIASQPNVEIVKLTHGQLMYKAGEGDGQRLGGINTIEVPKGGEYKVMLPDGSSVWLNAASSLRLPLDFAAGGERRVELSGEAYFEINHDPKRVFTVVSRNQAIQVLGTHFNVRAYSDEVGIKTSLLQGKVRVMAGTQHVILSPGQQAQLTTGTQGKPDQITVAEVNTENAIAWKNGYFHFDDERLEDVMRSVARWYDVKVVFEDESLKEEVFGAVTTRNASISMLLSIMEQTCNARFLLKNKTVRITAKESPIP
jgi:ferric-dicitrate binding protein FerR (iron transport regulator)